MLDLDPRTLTDVLTATADLDSWCDLGHTAAISVNRVLAWAWKPYRLAECAQRLADGQRAPAIHVSRYWLHGQAYYTVSDGMHRTVAAREAGRSRIRARISGECWCRPEESVLDEDRRLWVHWHDPVYGPCLKRVPLDVDQALAAALLAVGVKEK